MMMLRRRPGFANNKLCESEGCNKHKNIKTASVRTVEQVFEDQGPDFCGASGLAAEKVDQADEQLLEQVAVSQPLGRPCGVKDAAALPVLCNVGFWKDIYCQHRPKQ